jgi:putative membrane protein
VSGILVLGFVWWAPLHAFVPGAFSAHMTMHMGVVAVAAPLLAYSVASGRLDPVPKLPLFFAPIPASIVELLVVWAWHSPVLHHAARHSTGAFVLEQSMFLASGLFVWLSAFGGAPADRQSRGAAGVVALLLTSMHMTLLGALLALPPRALYSHRHVGEHALDPLADQHLGGAIMLVVGGISYLAGGLWLSRRLLAARRDARPASLGARGAHEAAAVSGGRDT